MREYYGYALIAGIGMAEARHMLPGWIMDFYKMRLDYDARLSDALGARRAGLL